MISTKNDLARMTPTCVFQISLTIISLLLQLLRELTMKLFFSPIFSVLLLCQLFIADAGLLRARKNDETNEVVTGAQKRRKVRQHSNKQDTSPEPSRRFSSHTTRIHSFYGFLITTIFRAGLDICFDWRCNR